MIFRKNCFPAIFGGHLEFLHKMQKCIYLRNGLRFLTLRVSAEIGICKNRFLAIFGGHMEFLCKTQKHISETVQQQFQRNFSPAGYLQTLMAPFHKYHFPTIFDGHLGFLRKMQKRIYFRKGVRAISTKFLTLYW